MNRSVAKTASSAANERVNDSDREPRYADARFIVGAMFDVDADE